MQWAYHEPRNFYVAVFSLSMCVCVCRAGKIVFYWEPEFIGGEPLVPFRWKGGKSNLKSSPFGKCKTRARCLMRLGWTWGQEGGKSQDECAGLNCCKGKGGLNDLAECNQCVCVALSILNARCLLLWLRRIEQLYGRTTLSDKCYLNSVSVLQTITQRRRPH